MKDYTEPIPGSQSYSSPSHPIIYDTQTKPFLAIEPGLTKLELISAMCLHGLLSSTDTFNTEQRVKYAIDCAKELLKQLEADHE